MQQHFGNFFKRFGYFLFRHLVTLPTSSATDTPLNNFFLKKNWANPGLSLFIFVLFSLQFQYKLKKA